MVVLVLLTGKLRREASCFFGQGVCMSVCVCVFVCTCVHCVSECMYVSAYLCMHVYECVSVCACMCVRTCLHACVSMCEEEVLCRHMSILPLRLFSDFQVAVFALSSADRPERHICYLCSREC